MMKALTFEPIIDTLVESAARNSLLNSAVLEMLQFILKVGQLGTSTDFAGPEKIDNHTYCRNIRRTVQERRDIRYGRGNQPTICPISRYFSLDCKSGN